MHDQVEEMIKPADASNNALWSILKEITIRALWFPLLVFILHLLLGWSFDIYEKISGFDMFTHCIGGIAIAFFFSKILAILSNRGAIDSMSRTIRSTLVFTLTATAAVFWEFAEYIVDLYAGTRIQRNLQDTIVDMAFGIFGGMLFLIWWRSLRKD